MTFCDLGWAATDPVDAGTTRVIRDGVRILVDRGGLLRAVQDAVLRCPTA